MSTELQKIEQPGALADLRPASEVIQRLQAVQELMKNAMVDGSDYGKVPGCGNKPTLLKPGSEKLAAMFRLGVRIHAEVIKDFAADHREYETTVELFHQPTGAIVGHGVGTCSTKEAKYRYRKTADGSRLEHDNPADQYNTVRKMAKKRALVDAVITATNASCIFTQDIEDMDEGPLPPAKPTYTQRPPDGRAPAPDRKARPTSDGIQTFRVTINDVIVIREGTSSKGTPWTLIGVMCTCDNQPMQFKTFDTSWADYAKAGKGQLADIEAKPGKRAGDWDLTYIAAVVPDANPAPVTDAQAEEDECLDDIPFDPPRGKQVDPYDNGHGGRYTAGGD
jgi:hypothetical protein